MPDAPKPQPWEALRQRAQDPNAATFVDPQNGAIEVYQRGNLSDDNQKTLATRGLKPATPEDIEKRASFLENSTGANQTRAALDMVTNVATAGAVGKEDLALATDKPGAADARREAFEQASPGLAMGARVVGGAIPMAITGGAASALGAGAAAVGAAEGLGAGLADESADAAWHNRELSAGNIALAGLGGAVFSSAIPAVLRRGSAAIAGSGDAVAAAAGEVGENLGVQLEAKSAARAAGKVDKLPPGPTRDAVLVNGADQHLERVATEVRDVAERAPAALEKSDLDKATLKRLIAKDAPNQTEWATATAEKFRQLADQMPEAAESAAAPAAAEAPVSLAGKSLEDLKALPIEGESDLARVKSLKENPDFAATGKVKSNDAAGGITLVKDGEDLALRDGRHRLTAAKELGRDSIHGRYVDGQTGEVLYEGEIPLKGAAANDTAPASALKRAGNGARVHEGLPAGWKPEDGSPIDIRDWNMDDFVPEKGRSRVVTRSQYSGSDRLSKYQRGLVDEIKEGQDFIQTGRLANAKNEPTFEIKGDNTITLHNGKTRMIAAREMGREDIYGRVVIKHGGKEQVVFEGMIPVGRTGAKAAEAAAPAAEAPVARAGGSALRNAADSLLDSQGALDTLQRARAALAELRAAAPPTDAMAVIHHQAAIDTLQKGIADQSLFGRAAEAVSDFDAAHAKLPRNALEGFDPSNVTQPSRDRMTAMAEALEDRAAARAKWDTGGAKDAQAKRLLDDARRLRDNVSLADDVAGARGRAQPAPAAPESAGKSFAREAGHEAIRYVAEHALGHFVPGLGLAAKGAKFLWSAIDANGQAAVKGAARSLARGAMGAAESASAVAGKVAPTALETFSDGFPGAQEAFSARKDILTEMVRDPTVLPHALAESMGDLPRENPKLFQAMATRMAKATAYVTANLPAGIQTSLAYPRGVPPSQSSLREFATIWNSAMDPHTVVEAVSNGSATPAQIKTLKVVDPDTYQSLTQAVITEVGNNYSQMPAQTKQWLDILFQSDGIAGPGFSWKAATYMTEGEKKNPRGPMPMKALPPPSEQAPQASGINAIQKGVTNRGG